MQINLLWMGREYHSLENCLVQRTDVGSVIQSIILGTYEDKIYQVEYQIKTNQNWETVFVEIKSRHSNQTEHIRLLRDGEGNWSPDGQPTDQFKGCLEVDISLTPLTNTLPINRLKLSQGEAEEIQVIYFDLLERQVYPVRQKYTRLSPSEYQFETNDFEAKITVDDLGFVTNYPTLFQRTNALETHYGLVL